MILFSIIRQQVLYKAMESKNIIKEIFEKEAQTFEVSNLYIEEGQIKDFTGIESSSLVSFVVSNQYYEAANDKIFIYIKSSILKNKYLNEEIVLQDHTQCLNIKWGSRTNLGKYCPTINFQIKDILKISETSASILINDTDKDMVAYFFVKPTIDNTEYKISVNNIIYNICDECKNFFKELREDIVNIQKNLFNRIQTYKNINQDKDLQIQQIENNLKNMKIDIKKTKYDNK